MKLSLSCMRLGKTSAMYGGDIIPMNDLRVWLASESINFSGGSVTSWSDISGNNRHFSNYSGTPTYSPTGMNGQPAVDFATGEMRRGATVLAANQDCTIFIVFMMANIAADQQLFSQMGGGTIQVNYAHEHFINTRMSIYNNPKDSGSSIRPGLNVSNNVAYISSLQKSGTSATAKTNGAYAGSGTIGNYTGSAPYQTFLGVRNYQRVFTGKMSEVIIYGRNLSGAEYDKVIAYLKSKFSIS